MEGAPAPADMGASIRVRNRLADESNASRKASSSASPGKRHNLSELNLWYSSFNKRFGIALPYNEKTSPSTRPRTNPYKVVKYIDYLWYKDPSALEEAVETCSAAIQAIENAQEKVELLAVKLGGVVDASLKQATARRQRYGLAPAAPPSPTSARRNGDMPPPSIPQVTHNGLRSAQTSFTTDSSAQTSFWSNDGAAEQSRCGTPDTEMDGANDDHPLSSYPISGSLQDAMEGITDTGSSSDATFVPELSMTPLARNECYRVRDIPMNSFPEKINWPLWVLAFPLHLRLECHRAYWAGLINLETLGSEWKEPRTLTSFQKLIQAKKKQSSFQPGFETDFSDATLCARLHWTRKKQGPVFELRMLPPRREQSNAIQRRFGGHRFLYIDVPRLSKAPDCMELKGQGGLMRERFFGLLRRELDLLGCKWRFFHAQSRKSKNTTDPDFSQPGACQIIFFATSSGYGVMREMRVMDILDWAIPFEKNLHQTACKAGARIDLSVSRTDEGIEFHPDEIKEVEDTLAKKVSDLSRYDDPGFSPRSFDSFFDPKEVMNDGCNAISFWAMNELRKKLKWPYIPAVIQARIGGAKGLWYLETDDTLSEKPEKLIKISKSQKKLEQKACNLGPGFDKKCWTLNVVKYSHKVSTSLLYLDFIAILVDRGVSKDCILRFTKRMIKQEIDSFVSVVTDRLSLSHWIYSRGLIKDDTGSYDNNQSNSISAVLRSKAQRVLYMLNTGFNPMECRFLANEIITLGEWAFTPNRRNFKIPVPRSTMILGIADPIGCLKPGEIHLAFSEAFKDEASGQLLANLSSRDVLVARNPTMRRSDIQRVTTVYKSELSHLLDVVVFPTNARRPLAGKLQGGDYDGDMFWVCWQLELLDGFKNAPAPSVLPEPETFGIKVSKTTLGQALQTDGETEPKEQAVTNWQIEQARNRLRFNMLGIVTNTHGRVVYNDRNMDITSPTAVALTDLHDHIVDADKRGYEFDAEAWQKFKKAHGIKNDLPEPAYRQYLNLKQNEHNKKDNLRNTYNKSNILDRVVFEVVDRVVRDGIEAAKEALGANGIFDSVPTKLTDAALTSLYEDSLNDADSEAVRSELLALERKVKGLTETWQKQMGGFQPGDNYNAAEWNAKVAVCRDYFEHINPDDATKQPISEWVRRIGNGSTSYWDLLKASAAAKFCASCSKGKMIFEVLCAELCELKVRMSGPTCMLTLSSYMDMKPRPPRKTLFQRSEEDSDDGDDIDNDNDNDWERVEDEDEFGDDDWVDELC